MRKRNQDQQPALFLDDGTPNPDLYKPALIIPTKIEVESLANKTGESIRKCYFWLLAEKNKPKA